jgi:hypothetical protein
MRGEEMHAAARVEGTKSGVRASAEMIQTCSKGSKTVHSMLVS